MTLRLAIVGRPNVGKSTLFNRLAGKRLAIVDDRPGVTRDRRFGTGRIGDLELELIDTAGFEDVTDESLEARMRAQTEAAIRECDVALFVIDSRVGVTQLDEIFADVLRRHDRPVILVANKAEGRQGDEGTNEAFRLGLGEPIPLSAEHGEGLADLYAALRAFVDDPEELEDTDEADFEAAVAAEREAGDEEDAGAEPADDRPLRIAIVGRPNAGKSTLVNRLIGEDRLLTGPEAGITRDAIPVDWSLGGRAIRLVDTAGLRRKARVQEGLEKLSTADTIRAITFAEVVILVVDATHPFEIQDLQIADLVEREGRALVFVLAKWDLIDEPQSRLAEIRESLDRQLPQVRGAPLVALSAETGRNVDRLMPAVFKVHENWSTRVKTRDLNDWLAMAIQRHPPPAVNGRRIRPKYMAQTKARPPTFVLFATRAEQLPDHYRRYLVHALRESFDLPGVPIRVSVRSSRNPFVDGPSPKASAPSGGVRARGAPRKASGASASGAGNKTTKAAKTAKSAKSTKAPGRSRPAAGSKPASRSGASPGKVKGRPASGRAVRAKGPTPRGRPSRPGKS
ncbi:ribosome biogenesis GTPase Der [Phenylobacterium sp.]|jgi:GTP-binding protein|uniref:ribosome biogenesis GTPase Der n=1 Tax=Phenylobacterium sp. TaxID=1871053 RepID=UPI0037C74D4B